MNEKADIIKRIEALTGWKTNLKRFKIVTDTSDWMLIQKGDIIRLDGNDYLVRGNMREPRFGIDDQPKYWVFSAIELATGKEKIIKTVYKEEFIAHVGILKIRCYRSPKKEGEVLDDTRGDERFMQGVTFFDDEGNNVRVIDYIRGITFFRYIPEIKKPHEQYFHEDLPDILWEMLDMILGIQKLHNLGYCHGDIRNDHIIIESGTRRYRWIDFDLMQDIKDFDLWSLGNIINYAVGKGIITFDAVLKSKTFSSSVKSSLTNNDGSAFYNYRIMNLQKIFPYIPEKLGHLLRHFTIKPVAFYTSIKDLLHDYTDMLETVFPRTSI